MVKVTIKGILAHKVRFLLTGVAVILGVSFIAGTLVLTATINRTFDGLFANIYANTDAAVRQKAAFDGSFGAGRGRLDDSVVAQVRETPGVAEAAGTIQGAAWVIDKHDKALNTSGQGAPALGFGYIKDRDLSAFHVSDGHGPEAPNQIVIDKNTADKTKYTLGSTVPVVTKNGRAKYELVGIAKFGNADSLLGATAVLFTPRDRQPRARPARQGRRGAGQGGLGGVPGAGHCQSEEVARRRPEHRGPDRSADHQGEPERHQGRARASSARSSSCSA